MTFWITLALCAAGSFTVSAVVTYVVTYLISRRR
jgi:hypothetical protein